MGIIFRNVSVQELPPKTVRASCQGGETKNQNDSLMIRISAEDRQSEQVKTKERIIDFLEANHMAQSLLGDLNHLGGFRHEIRG